MEIINQIIGKNGLIFAFLLVGSIMLFAKLFSKKIINNRIPDVAIAILFGLSLAFFGGEKGLADIPLFSGLAILGGSMLRDFSVVATAMGADLNKIRQAGLAGVISLFIGVTISFFLGVVIALNMGYSDAESLTTIGAGA